LKGHVFKTESSVKLEEVLESVTEKKVFLDTNALWYLSGLTYEDKYLLKKHLEENDVKLHFSTIQVDETTKEFASYQEKIDAAKKNLSANGIDIVIEPPKIAAQGFARQGYTIQSYPECVKIYHEIAKHVEECMGKKAERMNVFGDALIAVTSLNHDYFVTGDWCLWKGWQKIIENNVENKKCIENVFKIPKIIHAAKPQSVLNEILSIK
jgi:hypothetical protein